MPVPYVVSSVFLIILAFFVFRIIVRNDYLKNGRLSPISYLLELLVFCLHAVSMYAFTPFHWSYMPSLPENIIVRAVSIVLLSAGIIILFVSWFGLGTGPSFGLDKDRLQTDGLYRYSRNPQLVGYGLIVLVFAFLFSTSYAVVWAVLYILISYFMIKSEEEFLSSKYGEEYRNYRKQVPRILLFF